MNPLVLVAACSCLFLFEGCLANLPKPEVKAAYSNIDDFQKELAARARDVMGETDDFKIVVTQVSFPIGTIMHVGSTRPIDYTGCVPPIFPQKYSTPSLFPSYNLSKPFAIEVGLANEAIKNLADVGVTINDTDQIVLSIKDSQLQVLADNDITKILSDSDCRNAISTSSSTSSVWLIRGYIFGRRNFLLKSENTNTAKGTIKQIASFSINVLSKNQSVNITDESEQGFLQIVSQVTLPNFSKDVDKGMDKGGRSDEVAALGKPRKEWGDVKLGADMIRDRFGDATKVDMIEQPKLEGTSGLVYVQRDRQDLSNESENILKTLQSDSFNVEHDIQQVDSSHMPKIAQVRYFNEKDKSLANRALKKLQKFFPTAVLIRTGLPAPSGQIEIWLPKVQD